MTTMTITDPVGAHAGVCPAAAGAAAMLREAERFLALLDDRAYSAVCPEMASGTIGRHMRHVMDHFAAVLAAAQARSTIDYDHRERDTPMETSRAVALDAIRRACEHLATVDARRSAEPLRVRIMLSADGEGATLSSTLGREIAFAAHHAVHHYAMMKVIADSFGIAAPDGFGKAPATLNHESSAA